LLIEVSEMIIYIDSDFKCHVTNKSGECRAIETDIFEGKCSAYIEGFRFVPAGESWTRHDGKVFHGEMITPFKDSQFLETVQSLYEEMKASSVKEERIAALEEDNAALREENALLMECILEMSEIVYA